jgi:hypothetical protein
MKAMKMSAMRSVLGLAVVATTAAAGYTALRPQPIPEPLPEIARISAHVRQCKACQLPSYGTPEAPSILGPAPAPAPSVATR